MEKNVMQKEFERLKGGNSCGLDTSIVSINVAIDEIVNCELSWGAEVTFNENFVSFKTKVFGDVDNTKFTGTEDELKLIREVCDAWDKSRRGGVSNYILNMIGIDSGENIYTLEDVLIVLELHLSGSPAHELIPLLVPAKPQKDSCKPMSVSPELLKISDDLDEDDSVRRMIKGFHAMHVLNEFKQVSDCK